MARRLVQFIVAILRLPVESPLCHTLPQIMAETETKVSIPVDTAPGANARVANFIRHIIDADLKAGKYASRHWSGQPGPAAVQKVGAGALILLGQPMVGVLALIVFRAIWGVITNAGRAGVPLGFEGQWNSTVKQISNREYFEKAMRGEKVDDPNQP